MSIMSVRHAMLRIEAAPFDSPLAVFRIEESAKEADKRVGHVNVVFARTVRPQELIEARDPALIGVYDGSMNMRDVFATLRHEAS